MNKLQRLIALLVFGVGIGCASTLSAQVLRISDPTTITANGGQVCWGIDKSVPSLTIRIAGTWTGTIEPRVRYDNTSTNHAPPTGAASDTSVTANGVVIVQNNGFVRVCMLATAAMTGEATFSAVAGGMYTPEVSLSGDVEIDTTGLASETKQDTIIGHVDGLETLIGTTNSTLTTIDGRVDGLETLIGTTNSSLTTLDGRVDGIEGLLTTLDGRVDGLEGLLTTTNTSLSALDDTAAEDATEYLAVRLTDGSAFLNLASDLDEDDASVGGESGPMVLTVRRDSPTSSAGTDGDFATLNTDANGRLYTLVSDGLGALNVIVDSITAGDNNIGNVDIASITAGDNDIGNVDLEVAGTGIAAGAGTISAQSLRINIATDDPVNDALVDLDASLVAHDAIDAGSTVANGYRAIAHGTNPTAVAAGDRTVGYANRAGVPFMIGGHPNAVTETVQVTDADGAQTGTAVVSVSAGTKIVVTRVSVKCSKANSGNIDFRAAFDTDATFTAASEAGVVGEITSFDGIQPGGGSAEGNGGGILGVGADDEDLRYSMSDPAGGSCTASFTYYTIES